MSHSVMVRAAACYRGVMKTSVKNSHQHKVRKSKTVPNYGKKIIGAKENLAFEIRITTLKILCNVAKLLFCCIFKLNLEITIYRDSISVKRSVPYPYFNPLFTTQDTYGICLNVGTLCRKSHIDCPCQYQSMEL